MKEKNSSYSSNFLKDILLTHLRYITIKLVNDGILDPNSYIDNHLEFE